jgi:hypothetical protein
MHKPQYTPHQKENSLYRRQKIATTNNNKIYKHTHTNINKDPCNIILSMLLSSIVEVILNLIILFNVITILTTNDVF